MEYQLHLGNCLNIIPELAAKGIKVNAVINDPPYGITNRNVWDNIIPFNKMWEAYDQICTENTALIFTGRQPFTSKLICSNLEMFRFTMVWRKNLKSGNLNARKRPMVGFEDIIVFYKKQPTYNPQKIPRTFQKKSGNIKNSQTKNYGKQKELYVDRQSDSLMPDDVIDDEDNFFYVETLEEMETLNPMLYIKAVHNSTGKIHPTQKPVELMKWLIKSFTNEGDLVLDNTMGVAQSGIASIDTNRNYIGIEGNYDYFKKGENRMKIHYDASEHLIKNF